MKCKCGNDTFNAHQMVRMEVIVDEDGNVIEYVVRGGAECPGYNDADPPLGPYICTKCGAEHENLG